LKIIEDVWSLVRGYGIQLLPVVQSATQLKALYKETWENFWAQAGIVATIGPPGDLTTAKLMSERSGTAAMIQEGWNSGDSTNMQGPSIIEGVSCQQIARPFLLPQELMDMPVGTGRIWTPGKGTTSIPFFAPNFWKRAELRGLYDPNPYHQDATKADLPKTKGTTAKLLGIAGIIGAIAFTFGAHIPGGPAPAKAGNAGHVMAAQVHRSKPQQPALAKAEAKHHTRPHTRHHAKRSHRRI
jgi:type IV secretory pathway TraG/TraD family ATPase VirD4